MIRPTERISFPKRLALFADRPDECWDWPGHTTHDGYGRTHVGNGKKYGRRVATHRHAYELLVGPIPTGMHLDHLCRNRRCMNPRHLQPVLPGENNARGDSPSATNARKTHCVHGHPLTPDNVYIGRTRGRTPERRCKTCCALQFQRRKAAGWRQARRHGQSPPR